MALKLNPLSKLECSITDFTLQSNSGGESQRSESSPLAFSFQNYVGYLSFLRIDETSKLLLKPQTFRRVYHSVVCYFTLKH